MLNKLVSRDYLHIRRQIYYFPRMFLSTCVSYPITFEYQAQRHMIRSKGTRRDTGVSWKLFRWDFRACATKSNPCFLRTSNGKGKTLFSKRHVTIRVQSEHPVFVFPISTYSLDLCCFGLKERNRACHDTNLFFRLRSDSLITFARTSTRSAARF